MALGPQADAVLRLPPHSSHGSRSHLGRDDGHVSLAAGLHHLLVARDVRLAVRCPRPQPRVVPRIADEDLDGGHQGHAAQVRQRHLVPAQPRPRDPCAGAGRQQLLDLLEGVLGALRLFLRHHFGPPGPEGLRHVHESVVQDGAGEVQPLVHFGPLLRVPRVEGVALPVGVDEVRHDGVAVPKAEAVVVDGGDGVQLRPRVQEVDFFLGDDTVQPQGLDGQQHGADAGRQRVVAQRDGHVAGRALRCCTRWSHTEAAAAVGSAACCVVL